MLIVLIFHAVSTFEVGRVPVVKLTVAVPLLAGAPPVQFAGVDQLLSVPPPFQVWAWAAEAVRSARAATVKCLAGETYVFMAAFMFLGGAWNF